MVMTDSTVSNPEALDTFIEEARKAANLEVETSQEQPVEETQVDPSTEKPELGEEDQPKYSRRDAARIAEQLVAANEARNKTEQELEKTKVRSQELTQEVSRVLGTKEEYEAAEAIALDITKPEEERNLAAEKVRVFKANRSFYQKIEDAAHSAVFSSVQEHFNNAADLPGVNREVLMGPDLTAAFKNVYEAGKASADTSSLQDQITKLEAENKGLKATAANSNNNQTLSGGSSGLPGDISEWFDPKTGLLRDDIEQAARNGQLRG